MKLSSSLHREDECMDVGYYYVIMYIIIMYNVHTVYKLEVRRRMPYMCR